MRASTGPAGGRPTKRRTRKGAAWVAGIVAVLVVAAVVVAVVALSRGRADDAAAPATTLTSGVPTTPTIGTTVPAASATPTASTSPALATTSTASATGAPPTAPAASPTPTPAPVSVVLTVASWRDSAVAVAGYVAVIEDGGTCTVTLTEGDVTVSASEPATADVKTTGCSLLEIDDPRLTAGAWDVVLSYASPTSTGTSDPTTITIG